MFGNTAFVFIFHHSISGIVYPIRPQSEIKPMFMVSHIVGSSILGLEGLLAFLAFSGIKRDCKDGFPCRVQPLFNENFLDIPVVGQICNFYPLLNVSSIPVLTITLRNNIMEVVPIKQWLKKKNCCLRLLDVIFFLLNLIRIVKNLLRDFGLLFSPFQFSL